MAEYEEAFDGRSSSSMPLGGMRAFPPGPSSGYRASIRAGFVRAGGKADWVRALTERCGTWRCTIRTAEGPCRSSKRSSSDGIYESEHNDHRRLIIQPTRPMPMEQPSPPPPAAPKPKGKRAMDHFLQEIKSYVSPPLLTDISQQSRAARKQAWKGRKTFV